MGDGKDDGIVAGLRSWRVWAQALVVVAFGLFLVWLLALWGNALAPVVRGWWP